MNRFRRLRHRRTRPGYSLIELIIVISMSAAATGGSLVCISTMLRGERIAAVAVQESQVIARLRVIWNEDVHLAQEWKIGSVEGKAETQCDLVLKDGSHVQYRSSNWGLLRQVQRTGAPEKRDVFQFPHGTHFEFHQVEEPRLARLKVIRPAVDSRTVPGTSANSSSNVLGTVVMTFDSALGREARLHESLQTPSEAK